MRIWMQMNVTNTLMYQLMYQLRNAMMKILHLKLFNKHKMRVNNNHNNLMLLPPQ